MNVYADGMFYLLAGMFCVGVALLYQVARWYLRWRSPTANVMSIEEARDEFGQLMSERLGVAMRAAELDKVVIDRWDEWPMEYRPALYQVLRHTQLLEETMLEEAMRKGIYPKRIVTQGPAIAPPPQPENLPPTPEPTPPPTERELDHEPVSGVRHDNVVTLPSARWINGQLVSNG
jgi:hypothetical protein